MVFLRLVATLSFALLSAGLAMADQKLGNLSTVIAALRSGGANITIMGDSVAEGTSQIHHGDSYASLLERALLSEYPDKHIAFRNLSVPGWSWAEADSDAFVSPASFSAVAGHLRTPPLPELWPGGSASGVSWVQQVRNTAPHLLVVQLGVNAHVGGSPAAIRHFMERVATWSPRPSVILVTPALTTRTQGPMWEGIAESAQATADVIRGIAAEFNATVADANALYRLLIDGVDVARVSTAPLAGTDDIGAWPLINGSAPVLSSSALHFLAWGIVHRDASAVNSRVSGLFEIPPNGVAAIWYRSRPTTPGNAYFIRLERYTGRALLYANNVEIASAPLPAAPAYRVVAEAVGARHRVWIDGQLFFDLHDYRQMHPGRYGIEATTGVVASEFHVQTGYAQISEPRYSEADLLGLDDWHSNPDSLGGNSINHPTVLGHREVYFDSFAPVLDFLRTAVRLP